MKVEYTVVMEDRLRNLCEHVESLLAEGWVCAGGVSMTSSGDLGSSYRRFEFVQAMTKEQSGEEVDNASS